MPSPGLLTVGASAEFGTARTSKPTIVLVHGAWADASSWKGEIVSLQEDGYTVVAPPNPLRGLTEDSGYVVNYLKTISGPVVVVGHSYGGAVITNAAIGNPNVKALAFVDPFIPAKDEVVALLLADSAVRRLSVQRHLCVYPFLQRYFAALGTISQPSGVPAWQTIPSWDLIGTADHIIPRAVDDGHAGERAHQPFRR